MSGNVAQIRECGCWIVYLAQGCGVLPCKGHERRVLSALDASTDPGERIELLGLGARTLHALLKGGVTTVQDIESMTPEDLLALSNFGPKSLGELDERLLATGHSGVYRQPPPARPAEGGVA